METTDTIGTLITEGLNINADYDGERWLVQVEEYLRLAFDEETLADFQGRISDRLEFCEPDVFYKARRGVGYLQGLRDRRTKVVDEIRAIDSKDTCKVGNVDRRVFLVHGHNAAVKESVARFVEKLGLQAIILHEQPSSGKTVIEKFETCSEVSFAIVLLTDDDVGSPKGDAKALRPRARQNVVFELGYFIGRLTRRRVCALHSGNVEIPSDYHGVVYVSIDTAGAWRTKLAQELVEAGLPIDLTGLVA